jgi:hypothetical protein
MKRFQSGSPGVLHSFASEQSLAAHRPIAFRLSIAPIGRRHDSGSRFFKM